MLETKPLHYLAVLMLLVVILASPAAADKVHSKYDRAADFTRYETFRWQFSEKPRGPRVSPGGYLDGVIRELVTEALESKGLTQSEDDEADLMVSYEAVAVPTLDMGAVRQDLPGDVSWVVDGPMRSYYDGTLVVTLSDAETGKPVWSGWTTRQLEGDEKHPVVDEEKLEKIVRKVTKKIMTRFPPRE